MCRNPLFVPSKAVDALPKQRQGVRCNKCDECLAENQREWIYRLESEKRTTDHSFFATLTYSPEYVPLIDCETKEIKHYKDWIKQKSFTPCEFAVCKKDVQDYWKRVREYLPDVELKHYSCLEYGDKFGRPHVHYVVFYNDCDPTLFEQTCKEKWPFGNVQFDPICEANIRYVTKYLKKGDAEAAPTDISPDPCSLKSHGLGIKGFLEDERRFKDQYQQLMEYADRTKDYSVLPKKERLVLVSTSAGAKLPLPRYFRRKFYKNEDFLTEQIIEDEKRRNKKKELSELRFQQDLRIKGYYKNSQDVWTAVSKSFDSERIKRDTYAAAARRKGL